MKTLFTVFVVVFWVIGSMSPSWADVRIKDLARVDGVRPTQLIGYGLVVGLAGTGDTSRSKSTSQTIANALSRFGLRVEADNLGNRNSAAVMVTALLPPFAEGGESIDVAVSSMGDARSLAGGTLLMTPLMGPAEELYALAQGAVAVGGFRYDAFGNLVQKNHPTSGIVSAGAVVEHGASHSVLTDHGALHLVLHSPDFTTASRISNALNRELTGASATAVAPSRVVVRLEEGQRRDYVHIVRAIEGTRVIPDEVARVVVSERTGTVVAGGDVRLGQVSVTHGALKVSVETSFLASQPLLVSRTGSGVRTVVTPEARIKVDETPNQTVSLSSGARVSDLAAALGKIKASPRDIVTVLQAIHRAGALRAELVVQ